MGGMTLWACHLERVGDPHGSPAVRGSGAGRPHDRAKTARLRNRAVPTLNLAHKNANCQNENQRGLTNLFTRRRRCRTAPAISSMPAETSPHAQEVRPTRANIPAHQVVNGTLVQQGYKEDVEPRQKGDLPGRRLRIPTACWSHAPQEHDASFRSPPWTESEDAALARLFAGSCIRR